MEKYDRMAELQRNWTPPPELTASGPRRVRLAGGGIALLLLAGALFLAGIAAGIAINHNFKVQTREQDLLSAQGKETEAVITRLWRTGGKEDLSMVAYQFENEGRIYHTSVSAPHSVWKTLVTGAPLGIRFVASNPAINRPRDWTRDLIPGWLPFLIGLLFAAISAGLLFLIRRQMHLLSEGRPAPAIVTHYSNAQHGKKNIHYEFPVLSGALGKGKSGPARKLPPVGATLCVIYDRDNPRRNAPYPMDLVKLDARVS